MNLEEVARLAGVSRSTVSRVVNGDARVSKAARARVQEVIRAHNYHPHAAARSLASRRTRIFGLFIPRAVGSILQDPWFPLLIQGCVEAGNATDHDVMLLMNTSDDERVAERLYQRVTRGRHLDGIIIAASVVEEAMVPQLLRVGFPFVMVGRHPHPDVSYVDVDNRAAAQDAVNHLIDHGYQRIAAISGPTNKTPAIDRHAGYVAALRSAGRALDPSLMIHADFTQRGGYEAMWALLESRHFP